MQGKTCADGDMPFQLALRAARTNGVDFSGVIPLGAERRLAELSKLSDDTAKTEDLWKCPEKITDLLKQAGYIRLQLATPAIFNNGWYPDWLSKTEKGHLAGTIPKTSIYVELVAAAVGRFVPISGYAYGRKPGIKSTKKMVPAGSVYFFQVLDGDTEALTDLWLHPICGKSYYEPDSNLGADGFGLALWGVWQPKDNEG
jgi:CRISPR-associated protein Cmr3